MSRKTIKIQDIAATSARSIAIGPFGSNLKAELYTASGVPVVRGQNIKASPYLDEEDLVFVSPETAEKLSSSMLNEGDLVFPHRGAIGRVGLVGKQRMLLSSSMMKLTVNPAKADPKYVLYYFRGPGERELLMRASTVGTPGIGQPLTSLRGISIELPELEQQQAIAEVLGALDDKIAANTKLAAAAEDLAVALLSSFKPTVHLDDIVGYHKNSTNPELLNDSIVAQFSLPAFDSGQLPDESSPLDIKSSKFLIERPSVLVSKLNPRFPRLWNVSQVPSIPALASTEFLVLEPLHSSTTVLWAILSQPGFSAALESKVAGTSGSHQRVKPGDLLATLVLDPRAVPADIQDRVTSTGLVAADTRLQNANLAATRDALLPQLMSGKLRVKDAETLVSAAV
ncbi:restriction endonuclease subunit S [Arthrobacter alpinus]|uniref:restriction endonuclease subunit S n=1 Tax=Arthrobacter alpinus TaxID=656366 RepID=UPI0009E9501F|nr:restriction endonuclease subunit S [Arthrobacter alpinus]